MKPKSSLKVKGSTPERRLSVSRQISPRQESRPFGLPSVKGEEANNAVASDWSFMETRIFWRISASEEKSRLT
ncbi:hypothetical protein D3C87_2099510 [compost metagenome]